jgi:hypothetical protein
MANRRLIDRQVGLRPAEAQSSGWSGAGQLTGLESPPTQTFPEAYNDRVLFSSIMRGQDPYRTLELLVRGKQPLLRKGGNVRRALAVVRRQKKKKGRS